LQGSCERRRGSFRRLAQERAGLEHLPESLLGYSDPAVGQLRPRRGGSSP
jgi:hypothetical protein